MATLTAKEWFQQLEEPYRTQAIKNSHPEDLEQEYNSLATALDETVDFEASPEGWDYWHGLFCKLRFQAGESL